MPGYHDVGMRHGIGFRKHIHHDLPAQWAEHLLVIMCAPLTDSHETARVQLVVAWQHGKCVIQLLQAHATTLFDDRIHGLATLATPLHFYLRGPNKKK